MYALHSSNVSMLVKDVSYYHPSVSIQLIPGKGRGIVANTSIEPGSLILMSAPLLFIEGPPGSPPALSELAEKIYARKFTDKDIHSLSLLYDGESPLRTEYDLEASLPQKIEESQTTRMEKESFVLTRDKAFKIVRYNAYRDELCDAALCTYMGRKERSITGLWPDYAMLNHSCACNTINWVNPLGIMVVLTTQHVHAGEELTAAYIGRELLTPLKQRRDSIRSSHHFLCECERCAFEEDLPDLVSWRLSQLYATVQTVYGPALAAAEKPEGVLQLLMAMKTELAKLNLLLEDAVVTGLAPNGSKESSLSSLWCNAAIYDMWEAVAAAAAVLGDGRGETEAEEKCLQVLQSVAPGSTLHLDIAANLARMRECAARMASSKNHQDSPVTLQNATLFSQFSYVKSFFSGLRDATLVSDLLPSSLTNLVNMRNEGGSGGAAMQSNSECDRSSEHMDPDVENAILMRYGKLSVKDLQLLYQVVARELQG